MFETKKTANNKKQVFFIIYNSQIQIPSDM